MIVGIDPSSFSLAAAVIGSKGTTIRSVAKIELRKKGKKWSPQQAHDVKTAIDTLLVDTLGVGVKDVVYMEEPVFSRAHDATVVQSYVSGIVQSVVSGTGCRIVLVNNMVWKKTVIGMGNAKKEDTIRVLTEQHGERLVRFCGTDSDLWDAAGVALFGAIAEGG